MKKIILYVIIGIGLSACATHQDNSYYERANKANDKAQSELSR